MTPDNIQNIIIAIIAGVFGGGLVFITNWYKIRRETDIQIKQEEDRHEVDSGKLALELAAELRARIDQQQKRIAYLECEVDKLRAAGMTKDDRIADLERRTVEQEEEIQSLRKMIADKDETIARLSARLDALEPRKRPRIDDR